MKKLLSALIVLSICGTLSYFLWTCNHKKISKSKSEFLIKQDAQQIKTIGEIKNNDTTIHSIIKGVSHSEKTVASGTKRQVYTFYKPEIKQRENQLNLKNDEHISNVLSFKAEVKDSIVLVGENLIFPINSGCSHGTIKVSKDLKSLTLIEETNIHIAGTIYWKKKRNFDDLTHFRLRSFLAGTIVTKQDISSDCPDVKIDSISSIQIIKGL